MRVARIVAALLVLAVSSARGQHYRVVVGLAETQQMLLFDFSPCIPAEGSGCGGFLTRTIDARADSTFGKMPETKRADTTASLDRIAIADGRVVLTHATNSGPPQGFRRTIVDSLRTPAAVVAADRYAFAVWAPSRSGDKARVQMFDLETLTSVASLLIDGLPSGIGLVR